MLVDQKVDTNQWKTTDISEVVAQKYDKLIFNKDVDNSFFSTNGIGANWMSIFKEINLDSYSHLIQKLTQNRP